MRDPVFEQGVLIKLFYNKELQSKYLKDLIPLLFTKERKVIAFSMKHLFQGDNEITVENLLLAQRNRDVINYTRKVKQNTLSRDYLTEFFEDTVTSRSPELFKEAFDVLHDETFFEFTERYGQEFTYDLAYKNKYAILARAKAIQKVYDILYRSKYKNREDGIRKAVDLLRSKKIYVPTFSPKYNAAVGGFSRGFAAAVMGKPSHGKSTFMTWLSMYLVLKNLVDKVAVLSAEEPEEIFWRRVISAYYKIPMDKLKSGEYEISEKQIDKLMQLFENKINFYPVNTLAQATDVIFTLEDTELIWIDHINALSYPRNDMNQGIATLMSREKEYLGRRKDVAIVNLSQVNAKKMLLAGRLVATKEDAFGSSYLEHAAREMITVYYPFADATDEGMRSLFFGKHSKYKGWDTERMRTTVELHVQKNSFGNKPVIPVRYYEDMGRFKDTEEPLRGSNVILPEPEEPKKKKKFEHTGNLFGEDIL